MAASATPQLPKPPLHRPRLRPSVRSSATSSCRWAVGSASSSTILFEAIANFRSSDPTVGDTVQGFSVWEQTPFPTNYTFDSAVSDFISRQCISCLVDNIHWESQTLKGVQSTCLLADQNELNHRVADFLRGLEAAPCNAGQTELSVHLTILQEITLPAEEFEEWTSWYYDQAAVQSESFVEEYNRAIMEQRRRHTEIEEGLDQVSSGWLDTTGLRCVTKRGTGSSVRSVWRSSWRVRASLDCLVFMCNI